MSTAWILLIALLAASGPTPVTPYASDVPFDAAIPLDRHVAAQLAHAQITPAPLCSDAVFVRRVFLDATGTLPTTAEVRRFLADGSAEKRAALIDDLLARPEFADYWSLKWCDVLRVKAEFPINLWPNAVQAYHRWIHDALANNVPYDTFARDLLTSSGSNFRVPPVNFYRAVQGHEPEAIAEAVALTFMGTRLERWPAEQQRELAAFFSRLAFKRTAEWKEEIVFLDPEADTVLDTRLPDGVAVQIAVGQDPRMVFADWLIRAENPWFARCAANRVWAWLMGRGIVHEPDDMRADNPPACPALLEYLADELIEADFDLRHLYRLILNSGTYQQAARPRGPHAEAECLFASYSVRRLEAEVLIDAINTICGSGEAYTSAIPEPFTYIPNEQRTILLADGSISSPFLEMFGRPSRDTGLMSERNNASTDAQRMFLLNSSVIHRKLDRNRHLDELIRIGRRHADALIDQVYLTVLSRMPTTEERETVSVYLKKHRAARRAAVVDVIWALINTKEFQYRH